MHIQATTNDNTVPAPRQPAAILEREVEFRRLRTDWLDHNARWEPLHAVVIQATEQIARARGITGPECWDIAKAISDATGATEAGAAGSEIEARMYDALNDVIDTPAASLLELAAKARAGLLDLHSIENAASVDCEAADWDVHVLTRLVLDIERLAGRQA